MWAKMPAACEVISNSVAVMQGARWYRVCLALNFVALIVGVVMTAIINGVKFKRNDQDLGTQKVFWAAFEQPLVSFLVLTGTSSLHLLLLRGAPHPSPQEETD